MYKRLIRQIERDEHPVIQLQRNKIRIIDFVKWCLVSIPTVVMKMNITYTKITCHTTNENQEHIQHKCIKQITVVH